MTERSRHRPSPSRTPPTIYGKEPYPDGIRAVDDPAFGPGDAWPADSDSCRPLETTSTMIGLWGDDVARAHPLSLSSVHKAVDDDLGGPVLVMYYLICRGGMVAERVADGAPARSDASGLLWTPPRVRTAAAEDGRVSSDGEASIADDDNLVCDDRTGSYRCRCSRGGPAVRGPRIGSRYDSRRRRRGPTGATGTPTRRCRRRFPSSTRRYEPFCRSSVETLRTRL